MLIILFIFFYKDLLNPLLIVIFTIGSFINFYLVYIKKPFNNKKIQIFINILVSIHTWTGLLLLMAYVIKKFFIFYYLIIIILNKF